VSSTTVERRGSRALTRPQRLGEARGVVVDAGHARASIDLPQHALGHERFSSTYETPLGVRRLSSSTRKVPSRIADEIDAAHVDPHACRRAARAAAAEVVLRPSTISRDLPRRGCAGRRRCRPRTARARASAARGPRSTFPSRRRDGPRHEAEGEDLLGAARVRVHRERHALFSSVRSARELRRELVGAPRGERRERAATARVHARPAPISSS
jgi:hypothetical protein